MFARVEENGGYFVSRIRKNMDPILVFNRKKKSIGHAKAIIALARKIATIIWHLIVNDEIYEDEIGYKKGEIQKR